MIIYINGRFATQRITGVQRVAWEEIRRLSHLADIEVVLPPDVPEQACTQLKNMGITYQIVGHLKGHLWEQVSLPLFVGHKPLINFANLAPFFKKNQIVFIHDMAVRDAADGFSMSFKVLYRIAYRLITIISKRIVTVSNFSKDRITHYYPTVGKKINIIYCGSEHIRTFNGDLDKVLLKWNLKEKNYNLLVGSHNPNKNTQTVVDAFSNLNAESKLVIAGGAFSRVFANDERSHVNGQQVKVLGYVTDDELAALYEGAQCFIFPSKYEGFGIPPMEAIFSSTPVVASNIPVTHEIYGDFVTYFSDQQNLINIVTNHLYEETNIDAAKDMLRREYSWKSGANHLLRIMHSMGWK